MKTELTAIDKVRKLVGMDIAKSRVNLATETLNEGEATIEAEVFEAGEPVMIVNEEDRIPLPVGEYKLDNGMILVVEEEGVIASIGEEVAEEEAEATEETEEVAASDNKSETPLPKTIIESVTKEMKFSAEDMDAKDLEIAELKAKITELSKVEEVEVELSVAPITHNPENKKEVKGFKYGNNSKLTPAQVIMSKMANIK
jgi:hypothetical protein|tara:strand:- start:1521 stop:2120 length:600 start_codon:yes stop_codon:yes gene_type:complete